jgi:zinc/manganese transport system permease protein
MMLAYDFMRNALIAGSIVAIIAGLTGFFLVMRGETFAGHALSHVGFAGATGATLLGLSPMGGLIGITLLGGGAMGLMDKQLRQRDIAIGMVLSLSLGLGMLFLHFFTAYATQATALLFGNVLGVDDNMLWMLATLAMISLLVLALIARPLVFASLQPELAEAKGVSLRRVSVLFLMTVALATAGCIQIVGVLLVFTLMVGPAATAQKLTSRLSHGIALSVILALTESLGGITLAFYTDWPSSFWITALSGLAYALAQGCSRYQAGGNGNWASR